MAIVDRRNLPMTLFFSGVWEAVLALCLILFKVPGGIFLHHDKGLFYLYYAILIAVMIFGIMEVLAGAWVSNNLDERYAVGDRILFFSMPPLAVVIALGPLATLQDLLLSTSHSA